MCIYIIHIYIYRPLPAPPEAARLAGHDAPLPDPHCYHYMLVALLYIIHIIMIIIIVIRSRRFSA